MNNKKLKITIYLLALVQMGPIFMSPIIGEMVQYFSNYSASVVQMLMTFPNLVVVFMSILTGKLETKVSKRNLCLFACICVMVSSIGLYAFHTSLPIMFVFSGILGIGVGILLSITATIVALYFTPEAQGEIFGLQNSFTNMGGMMLNLLGGTLAGIAWYYDFLSPLIVIAALVMVIISVPNEKGIKVEAGKKEKMPSIIYFYLVIVVIFMIIFNALPTNLSIFLSERNLGGTSFSGICTAVLLGGGTIAGMLFGKLSKIFGEKIIAVGYFNLGLGLLIISQSYKQALVLVGVFIAGCSLALLMSQLTLSISAKTTAVVAPIAMSYLMAVNNLGNFICPTVFSFIPGNSVGSRYMIVGLIAIICAVLLFFQLKKESVTK